MSERKNPPIFPMGFRGQLTKDVLIVDFIDTPSPDEDKNVFYSVALSKDIAKEMIQLLNVFIEGRHGQE